MKTKRLKDTSSDETRSKCSSNIEVVTENSVLPPEENNEDDDLPLKRFKGTKWNGGEVNRTEWKEKSQNSKSKGVVDFTEESQSKSNESQNHKSYEFLSKLEQFSDVWNDCPTIKNPKENVESWCGKHEKLPIHKQMEDYDKACKGTSSKNKFERGSNATCCRIVPQTKETISSVNVTIQKSPKSLEQLENETNNQKSQIENSKKSTACNHPKNSLQGAKNYDSNISDLKRKKAMQEHNQLYSDKKNIIKQALSSMDGKDRPNKKIVFDDAEELEESKIENSALPEDNNKLRPQLFDDNDLDVEADLKINHQFKGKKGQKLLELQSKFASDSRFALDTRFYESGSDEGEKSESEATENVDNENEKRRQLEILESIVKKPIKPLSEIKRKKATFSDETNLRFDPTREDHQKYIITQPNNKNNEEDSSEKRQKKKKKELEATSVVEANKTKVTKEKFVAVKEDLKEALKKDVKEEFSLLKLFGPKESDKLSPNADQSQTPKKLKYGTKNPFKYDSSDSEPEENKSKESSGKKAIKKGAAGGAKASWKTTFFFTENDPRLEEAFEFLKCPEEIESDKEFAERRKSLKDFIRHKFKNSNRKKTPFKKKLGGYKKNAFQKKGGKPKSSN